MSELTTAAAAPPDEFDIDEGFFADDALPVHHLDDDGRRPRGLCPHSGGPRDALGRRPRGCGGATEHYSNDGHRGCYDPPTAR